MISHSCLQLADIWKFCCGRSTDFWLQQYRQFLVFIHLGSRTAKENPVYINTILNTDPWNSVTTTHIEQKKAGIMLIIRLKSCSAHIKITFVEITTQVYHMKRRGKIWSEHVSVVLLLPSLFGMRYTMCTLSSKQARKTLYMYGSSGLRNPIHPLCKIEY